MSDQKLLLVDGMALVHRGYHAIKERYTGEGESVNAVYGFFQMLLGVLEREKPDYVGVCFEGGKTYRHTLYPGYKAGRKPAPEDLHAQVPRIKEILACMGIPALSQAGLEADDLLGVLSLQAECLKLKTVILTGDHDLLQLVNPLTLVVMPVGGFAPFKYFNESAVLEKYGFYPKHLPDYKAIAGDSSDNIPGVVGVGEKGAKSLIAKYGSVEMIIKALEARRADGYSKEERLFFNQADQAKLFKSITLITRHHVNVTFRHSLFRFGNCDLAHVRLALAQVELGGFYGKFLTLVKGI